MEDKTFTQEEVNKLVGQARLEGKETARKEFEGYISPEDFTKKTADLNAQLGGLSDQIKGLNDAKAALEDQIKTKDGEIAKYATDAVKIRVARELGLPFESTEFIQGDDEEAIKKSAETLKSIMGTKGDPYGDPEPVITGKRSETDAAFMKMLGDLNKN